MSTIEKNHKLDASASPSQHGTDSISLKSGDQPPPPPTALSQGAAVTTEEYRTEQEKAVAAGQYAPPFRWSSLYRPEIVNPLNQKSYTIPLFNWNQYSIALWMSALGFFVAFLSWFAFAPLIPETIKTDLNLTAAEIGNSNIAGLSGTIIIRLICGPLVDRYGPRKVMAGILIVGAIPSGLAGLAHDAGSLYVIRFFISFLGATFVASQAWTTAFFDKSIVGTANSIVGGWGNMGGGITQLTQSALYERLHSAGLTPHVAWRVCFVILPVPVLLLTAGLMLLIAKDHPMGKWSQRHQTPAHDIQLARGHQVHLDADAQRAIVERDPEKRMNEKATRALAEPERPQDVKEIDVAVNEALTWPVFLAVITDMRTWMLSLGYATTFGYELALDANLANTLLALFKSPTFQQSDAGSLAATYGLLNLFCRFFGGLGSDMLYARYGIQAKKFWAIGLAILQGIFSIGLGMTIKHGHITIGSFMGWLVLLAFAGFAANGGTYSTLPHISSRSNGLMCGIVGAAGSVGGIMYALIFRFQTGRGDAFWISGVLCVGLNALLAFVPLGDAA